MFDDTVFYQVVRRLSFVCKTDYTYSTTSPERLSDYSMNDGTMRGGHHMEEHRRHVKRDVVKFVMLLHMHTVVLEARYILRIRLPLLLQVHYEYFQQNQA